MSKTWKGKEKKVILFDSQAASVTDYWSPNLANPKIKAAAPRKYAL